jgi:kynurenine formamidase
MLQAVSVSLSIHPQLGQGFMPHARLADPRADLHRGAYDAVVVQRIDLSHPIVPGMTTYPNLPTPEAHVVLDYEASRARYRDMAEFFIASLHLCGNTGTHVDAPIHRFRGGADLAALSLDRLAHLPVALVDARGCGGRGIGAAFFAGLDVAGKAVLVRTDWSEHWGSDAYFEDSPFLTREASAHLVQAGAVFVGIDSLNIDDTHDPARPAHTHLLGAGIPVCEHLTNLASVPRDTSFLHAAPIPWVRGATFPVRAYVIVGG